MAKRSFKITPTTTGNGHKLRKPDYWVLQETTGGKVREIHRFHSYFDALQANREMCGQMMG
ncbi:hypothetical protein SAMN02745148_00207 [Modicisalibacter ilicicola DSM 19980]|uniref:Uncharacterized protein n=1 Tax=Modicisalibacter ilicicola DSM 19980 TaxID=1121942 RepID=A0A1M4SS12_9GAMM|nr:hypothetical protein [Halomonas ilicicola]SHE34965.1 hypothetical protein SAMN02745148_00207 [Halomonas ilicicola DSM 19980]